MQKRTFRFKINRALLLASLMVCFLSACNVTLKIKDGHLAYDLKKYALAAELLPEDYEKAKDKRDKHAIAVKIAKSHLNFSDTEQAEQWFKKAVDLDVDPQTLLDYAMVLKQNEKYIEAGETLNVFYEYDRSQRLLVEGHLAAIKKAYEAKNGKSYTAISNLSDLNSEDADYAPIIKEGELIFSSNRPGKEIVKDDWTGKAYTNLYGALQVNDTRFDEVEPYRPEFHTKYHESVVAYNKDKTEIYFTRCGFDDDDKDVCKIFRSVKEFEEWSTPEQLQFFEDSTNEAHPFIAEDGTLYFTSDAEFGYGGKDIYKVKKLNEDEWESPINLGPRINTIYDEMFPYVSKDGRLFFASNGHFGAGGLDIFVADKRGRSFTNTTALDYPINTGADDFSIFLIESEDDSVQLTGYIASNREGGVGGDDIYFFEQRMQPAPPLPPAVYILEGTVLEKQYQDPNNPNSAVVGRVPLEGVAVNILDKTDINKPYSINNVISDADGQYRSDLDGNVDYLLEFAKKGYFAQKSSITSKNYDAKDGDTIIITSTVILEKVFEEIEFVLNIYYDLDKADIRPDAAIVLDSLANLLMENPTLKVELASHTDSRGKDAYNLDLSQRRADSAVSYLISKGIASGRLISRGYGETKLVNECEDGVECSEEQHQQNRRTTFKVVGLDYELMSE